MRAHADRVGGQAEGNHDLMVRINQAWEILGDERLRAAYDWLREHGR
jgi:curved DNA-binding protein CbpA